MININEFKIGNFCDYEDKIHLVVGIAREEDEYIIHLINDDDRFRQNTLIDNISPISLNEEWLIKLGFEEISHFTVTNAHILKIGRGRHLSIGCTGTPNEALFLCWMENENSTKIDDIIVLWNYDYDGKLHVHQLQNIINSLQANNIIK